MRKVIAILLALILVLSFTGCNAKAKLQEKIGEELAEKLLETAGGGDIEIDGDKVTIKGEDGEEVTFGGGEWPKSGLAKSIPEFKKGKISSIMELPDSLMITVEASKKDDVEAYFEKIRNDFPLNNYESKMNGITSLYGENDAGIAVSLIYTDEVLTIAAEESKK
jgi:hypothetical protein